MMTHKLLALLSAGLLLTTAACSKGTDGAKAAPAEETATTSAPVATDTPSGEAAAPVEGGFATQEMTLGNPDAKLTVIEYASVTCPGCAYFHANIYPKLKSDYIETGKINFVFREFPTAPQQLAYLGFVLSRCAADEAGPPAYFAMLNTLFQNQRTWVGENWQSEILKYAAQAGMSEEDFKACIARQDILDNINETIETGVEKYDVASTPTFILNDEKMGRYKDADEYFAMLDEALAAAEAE